MLKSDCCVAFSRPPPKKRGGLDPFPPSPYLVKPHGAFSEGGSCMYVRRLVSFLCVFCIVFSLLVIPSFALYEDVPDFDSDFIRYAPSSGSVTVGGDSYSLAIPPFVIQSSSGTKAVRFYDAQCNSLGDLHGHFTFVLIVGARNSLSVDSHVKTAYIESIDSDTNVYSQFSYIRPTNYRYNYSTYAYGSTSEVKNFNCITYVCEFDIPDDQTFAGLSQWGAGTLCSISGEFVLASFFLHSYSQSSSDAHLAEIENYLSILPSYCARFDDYLAGILQVEEDLYTRVSTMYQFMNTFTARFNTDYSRSATWDNMPSTTNGYNRLADMVNATVNEKKRQADREVSLSDLTDAQDTVISKTSENLPKFASGILSIFDFFDVSDSEFSLDFSDAFLGYEDYFGNVPFFFSSDISSRLEVQ